MSDLGLSGAQATAPSTGEAASPLFIAAPFYRNERLVAPFIDSLLKCSAELRALNARIVLFNDSPGHEPLAAALADAIRAAAGACEITVRTNTQNLGWLKTCNLAMAEAAAAGADIILLNSDTRVMPGAISEMVRVSRADPMIGFVNPRSNNATLATFPHGETSTEAPGTLFARFRAASASLPDLTYVPTSVGFAMLIRNVILREFGVFDEAYGGGYNEENDLVMRASRCGFRAVLANHAYIWHEGEQSLGAGNNSKRLKEEANRKILLSRYPEYARLVDAWFHSAEYAAEGLLSTLVPDASGRLDIAIDLSHISNFHNGTTRTAAQLLHHLNRLESRFNLHVLCDKTAYEFHNLAQTGVPCADPQDPKRFAAVFRIGQPFDWDALRRLSAKGAVTGVFMLDTIALDCGHLYDPGVPDMWQHVFSHSDFVLYNSAFTARQFQRRFASAIRTRSLVSPHSLDTADYLAPPHPRNDAAAISAAINALPRDYILVAGNQYPHKAVGEAANRIAAALPDLPVVALGVTRDISTRDGAGEGKPAPLGPRNHRLDDLPNLHGLHAGALPAAAMTELYRRARVIVMPSLYEGFGIPLLDALALERPFIARSLPPLIEINDRLGGDPNVHLVHSLAAMIELLRDPPQWRTRPAAGHLANDGERAARDIISMIEQALAALSYDRILTRLRVLHAITYAHLSTGQATNNADSAARRLGQGVERVMRPLFRVPLVYRTFQLAFRAAGAARRALRRG